MRRSFVRLVVSSVLATWILIAVVVVLYAVTQSWSEPRARADGVFLAYELLGQEAEPERARRLGELQQHSRVPLSLVRIDDVEQRIGRRPQPGERIHHVASIRRHWYFLVFEDGLGALAAGPVNPAVPPGTLPIGLILAVALLPVIAALIAFRIERAIGKVERASRTLATGDLSARVDGAVGPSGELAASFNEMAERIERLIRSREELVQAVSHELGSPLSRLRFHVELLGNDTTSEHDTRLAAITRDLDALDDLVVELLRYVQSGDVELRRDTFAPDRALADLVELTRLEVPDDRVVQVDLELPSHAIVRADPRLFLRAVENLLRNAVRHARSRVMVELIQGADHVQVAVHDDGPGIPEAMRDKVLTPFFRVQSDRGRGTGGVGLGLAIVDRIVQRHGGRVEIGRSRLGGAVVTTLWPARG